jgi:hypothetical protein
MSCGKARIEKTCGRRKGKRTVIEATPVYVHLANSVHSLIDQCDVGTPVDFAEPRRSWLIGSR